MTKEFKHVIWGDIDLNLEDWRADLLADIELNGGDPTNITDDELYRQMVEINDDHLEDERDNLNVTLPGKIIIFADLGRWNGRFPGCSKLLGNNLSICLEGDYHEAAEWFVDAKGDLCGRLIHHDGIDYYTYRLVPEDISESNLGDLRNSFIYKTKDAAKLYDKFTKPLGHYVAKVYGFDIPDAPSVEPEAE